MANSPNDYLRAYKTFFEEFAATVSPDDQLPVKVGGYLLCESEIVGEIVDWILQYLYQKRCPPNLVAVLTQTVLSEVRQAIKKQPQAFGFCRDNNAYQPLKLMQVVTSKVNDVCLRYLNSNCLESLGPPSTCHMVSACAVKNSRRRMEDRHTIIEDFHSIFDIKDGGLTNYYAVFDGHAGTDAAMYGVSHLHQFLAESAHYPSDPEKALRGAFQRTDDMFLEKSNRENLRSGTTALCALVRHTDRMLHIAWLGDSLALLVRRGEPTQLVKPHKPDRQDERDRIEGMGGCVMFWGTWRVNGQLAVSRAIGDLEYKPYVTATPDIVSIPMEDNQDFLILACDGLWDYVSEQEAVFSVYQTIRENPGNLEAVSQGLVQLSKEQGSVDNISVIVVFLTDPAQLAAMDVWPKLEETVVMDTTNSFHVADSETAPRPHTKDNEDTIMLEGLKLAAPAPSETDLYFLNRPSNGKDGSAFEVEDDDFGPETDVDAVDDMLLSPTIAATKAVAKNLRSELEVQQHEQHLDAFDPCRPPREETPTPPADDVSSGPALLPETENVAESGEESEDEWNYYRVEPAEKSELQQQPAPSSDETKEEEDEASMESQLNPNAAEFVPSPTALKPSMEELISASPYKGGVAMDDVCMPSPNEFQEEVSLRPSELDNTSFTQCAEVSESLLPDLLNGKTELNSSEQNPYQILDNVSSVGELLETANLLFDKSEVSSTKAEFGDETVASFLANTSGGDFLANTGGDGINSSCIDMDTSMTETDFVTANLQQEASGEELTKKQNAFALTKDVFEQNVCFELQNEFQAEGYQVSVYSGNENTCVDVNSTPLDLELGQVDFAPPVNVEFTSNPFEQTISDVPQDVCLSKCALSPNKDLSGHEAALTEELDAPELVSLPPSDVQMPLISTGMQSVDLDISSSSLVQLETVLTSPVKLEPVISDLKDIVKPPQFKQTSEKDEDLSTLLAQENVAHNESVVKVIETQPEENMTLVKEDSKHQEESPKIDDGSLLSGKAGQPVAIIAASSVMTAAIVGAALLGSDGTKTKDSTKKSAEKTKPSTKTITGAKSGTTALKAQPRTPTSPTKPSTQTSRSAPLPKKTTTTTTAGRATSKPTTTTATTSKVTASSKPAPSSSLTSKVITSSTSQIRVKAASSPIKAASAKTTATSKPRPLPLATAKMTSTEKKPGVTNGDVKPLNKRPETLATKTLVASTTTKPLSRPATAPTVTKTTMRTAASTRTPLINTISSRPSAKPSVNGVAKSKTTTTTATRVKPLSSDSKTEIVDKQVKDTANKQICSTKSSTMSRTATATTTRKSASGITKTTNTTTVTKIGSGKKPVGTTVTKTSEIITVTPGEVVVVEGFTTTITKDDSPIIDNAQLDVISSTD